MLHAVVFKPKIDQSKINAFRAKYDPHANLIDPHITLVFPINENSIDKQALIKHIENVLCKEKAFKIHLQGLEKSWDHWLNLILKDGNNDVIRLHDQLYTNVLAPFLRKDLRYTPHVGLGLFVSNSSQYNVTDPTLRTLDKEKYKMALQETETINFDYWTVLNNLELITLDDKATTIIDQQQFMLSYE